MANTTSSITHAVNRYYDRVLLERALPNLVHTSFGQVRDIPAGNTNVINFRRYSSLSAATTALSAGAGEGVTPTGSNLSITDVPCTVLQYGDFTTVTDFLSLTTLDPIFTEAAQVLGEQAGLTLDTLARDVIWATTSVQYCDVSSPKVNAAIGDITTSDVLAADELNIAIATMLTANAKPITMMVNPDTGYLTTPVGEAFVAIIHPNSINTLYGISGFLPVEQYARSSGTVMPGEVGKYRQLRFIASTNAKVYTGLGSGGINVQGMLILGKNAYGVTRIGGAALKNIRKAFGSGGTSDPLDQRATSGWKATFGSVILNQEFLLKVLYYVA